MAMSPQELERTFSKLGFAEVREERHKLFEVRVGNKRWIGVLPHGSRDIGLRLLGRIARQIGTNVNRLKQYYRCNLTREDYLREIEAKR